VYATPFSSCSNQQSSIKIATNQITSFQPLSIMWTMWTDVNQRLHPSIRSIPWLLWSRSVKMLMSAHVQAAWGTELTCHFHPLLRLIMLCVCVDSLLCLQHMSINEVSTGTTFLYRSRESLFLNWKPHVMPAYLKMAKTCNFPNGWKNLQCHLHGECNLVC
jgi:hypothetical protein